MNYKVAELEGALLDSAVLKAVSGGEVEPSGFMTDERGRIMEWDGDHALWRGWSPTTDWRVGGPLIEREQIVVVPMPCTCAAFILREYTIESRPEFDGQLAAGAPYMVTRVSFDDVRASFGPTPLVAAMRAYVRSAFGDEIELGY